MSKQLLLYAVITAQIFAFDIQACSIIGYVGDEPCKDFILEGLKRLEYRGYDSAGLAFIPSGTVSLICQKAEGKLENLLQKISSDTRDGQIGIGHTRWATHGPAIEQNAHPHTDNDNTLAVVHNGIIENYLALKQDLQHQGCIFKSDTDTEVIAHLLRLSISNAARSSLSDNTDTLVSALVETSHKLQGSYAFVALVKEIPNTLIVLRKGSPACIGVGENEMFIASDFLALAGKTEKIVFMPEQSIAIVHQGHIELYDHEGLPLPVVMQNIKLNPELYQKLGHEHYMLKEIYEQQNIIRGLVNHCRGIDNVWEELGMTSEEASSIKRIHILGCGTSWHAARIAQFYFESVCHIPTYVHLASEFRYMPFFPEAGTLYIAVSQSGETADTLEAVRLINRANERIISITNVPTSSMVRETNGFLPLMAGPEIAVASTKAFSAQVSMLYWLAHKLAHEKKLISSHEMWRAEEDLISVAAVLENAMETHKVSIIDVHAQKYAKSQRFIFLGRHISYPFAMEAALKLKEISYIFAQGYPAGELKHGSIALIDVNTPVMLFSHQDETLYKKLLSNAQEVKARKGHLIAVAFEGQDELVALADVSFIIPRVAPLLEPLAMTGFMQFFVYQIAKELGCDIDKPRNLAKAVTVE